MMDKKEHWENIYSTKKLSSVSWYQEKPITAIQYLKELKVAKDAAIIDVGGGDSFFVDYLLNEGFSNISVLDISEKSLERAKKRLGAKAEKVKWIATDASQFNSEAKYDFWYDRAAFHFLTKENDIANYLVSLKQSLSKNAHVVIGTFSENGPTKCSGIEIKQYSATDLERVFSSQLNCISCQNVDHPTPFDTIQNFTFCAFTNKEEVS